MKFLRPFFSYYGGKWRLAPHYPKPVHETIIEPFAGSAGYSLRYYDRKVILYDKDPVIAGLWDYLIRVKPEEIMALPTVVHHIHHLNVCQEAKWLIGFWVGKGRSTPGLAMSSWFKDWGSDTVCHFWGESTVKRISMQVNFIKHWKILNKSYHEINNCKATWFIDPPYNNQAGKAYKENKIRYGYLGDWCQERLGQVIACENKGAEWLPFRDFRNNNSTSSRGVSEVRQEVIWTNEIGTDVPERKED